MRWVWVALAILTAFPALAQTPIGVVSSIGRFNCGFLVKGPDDFQFDQLVKGWVLGYLDGANRLGPPHDINFGNDPDGVYKTLRQVCTKSPNLNLVDAAFEV